MRTTTFFLITGLALGGGLAGSLAAQQKLDSARSALAESLPEVAVARIERSLAANPKQPEEEKTAAYLLLAECYLRTNQAARALTTLDKIPDSSASARNYWQGMALAHQHEYPLAFQKFSQVEEDHPLFRQALFNALELQVSQKETTTAFELLKKLRAKDAQFQPNLLTLLEVQLHLTNNEPDKARTALKALTTEQQQLPQSQLISGQIELAAKQPQAARVAFEKVLTSETSPKVRALALLGKSDATLQTTPIEEALSPLLLFLATEESEDSLDLLRSRFELLIKQTTTTATLIPPLTAFVNPQTLGEDGNLLSPQKLFACYYLARISPPARAQELLQLIITLAPKGELTARAHIQLAHLALDNEDNEDNDAALAFLKKAQSSAPQSPSAMAAADLAARINTAEGDIKGALALFTQSAQHPDPAFSEQALLNQALLTLSTNPSAPLSALATRLNSTEGKLSLSLDRALALAREKSPQARATLEDLIFRHPEHPRVPQARLALAEILLSEQKPDAALIEVQLASLPKELSRELSLQKFGVSHNLAIITDDWTQSVSSGEKHRKDFPKAEKDPYFLLRLGESSFRNGDFNRSRVLFSKVTSLPHVGELSDLALYFNALSNLEIPTEKATTEALDTFDRLIKKGGSLATRARLRKARTQIEDLGRAQECLETLEGIPGNPGDNLEAALIAAQAHRELSANEPRHAEKALSIYRRLLADPRTSYQLSNEIHYLLSRTYSEIGKPNLAIDPCLSVVDLENRAPDEVEVEWDYYYRCGFEAIDILLEAKHAQAALTLAQKLAQTKGPSAKEAKERARQIQLDHLLWTE